MLNNKQPEIKQNSICDFWINTPDLTKTVHKKLLREVFNTSMS